MEQVYYNAGGICTNEGMTPLGGTSYSGLLECCEATQPEGECEFVDICCEMRSWYLSTSGVCTNGFLEIGEFTTLQECCEETQPDVNCLYDDICSPNPPTPEPTAVEIVTSEPTYTEIGTPVPTPIEIETPAPTTCMEQEYYTAGGICTNEGITPPGGTAFPTLLECCEETQTAEECEFVDICCEMRLWYLSESGVCTNGFTQDGEFASLQECCEETQSGADCLYDDICNPDPPAPTPIEVVSMVPTLLFTPEPTPGEGTGEPTFGSTPTVSKEVTGPPTKGRN
jgi:hypothetical protein